MTTAEKYVTAAYLVVLAVVLLYLVLYAFKLQRLGREVEETAALASRREPPPRPAAERDPETRLARQ